MRPFKGIYSFDSTDNLHPSYRDIYPILRNTNSILDYVAFNIMRALVFSIFFAGLIAKIIQNLSTQITSSLCLITGIFYFPFH